ncbi:DUF4177 domain-containing protein [Cerasicoccus fimbriatus]|uniref:DUF4177 domain-containing protein n=1 Tax=Cerasicoccus fimbriatus TaxID=3014554 RepID=UPI0022B4A315|nr:DUF4177 domain-containing protein [Cerasicoccus sp. TK19100]
MKRFEYKVIKFDGKGILGGKVDMQDMEQKMNAPGQEGWEAVSVFDTNEAYGSTRWVIATFKRELS